MYISKVLWWSEFWNAAFNMVVVERVLFTEKKQAVKLGWVLFKNIFLKLRFGRLVQKAHFQTKTVFSTKNVGSAGV